MCCATSPRHWWVPTRSTTRADNGATTIIVALLFGMTLPVTPAQDEAFAWVRAHLPEDATLQMEPMLRGREHWSTSRRTCSKGDPSAVLVSEGAVRLSVIKDKPISFEVFCDEFSEMERHAREIASWGDNVYVKIPVTNCQGEGAYALIRRLADDILRLAVWRRGFLTLEYLFPWGGGAPGWVSGMAQATGMQALAGAAVRLGDPRLLRASSRMRGAFETSPPWGVRRRTGRGRAHFLLYSHLPRLLVGNGFAQALIGLADDPVLLTRDLLLAGSERGVDHRHLARVDREHSGEAVGIAFGSDPLQSSMRFTARASCESPAAISARASASLWRISRATASASIVATPMSRISTAFWIGVTIVAIPRPR